MRVTTGSAKGKRLRAVAGETTRPVTDRVKQAVFNILMDDVLASRWLDVFAGTGSVGIEALSRGAAHATFVDTESEAVKTIKLNLQATGLERKATVIRQDALRFLSARPNAAFDFIYIAPPQYRDLWAAALEALDRNFGWLDGAGAAIVQIDPREFRALPLANLELVDQRKYGRTALLFYERASG